MPTALLPKLVGRAGFRISARADLCSPLVFDGHVTCQSTVSFNDIIVSDILDDSLTKSWRHSTMCHVTIISYHVMQTQLHYLVNKLNI